MKWVCSKRQTVTIGLCAALMAAWLITGNTAVAETKVDKAFTAVITDVQGVETEVKNILFYWEEKVSETAFVPHELKQLPVKRGAATVYLKFDTLKQIEAKPGQDKNSQTLTVTLGDGKTGEFMPAIAGSFKGESDFGQVELPLQTVAKVVFK
ncbi:MAG: hypothetical protein ACREJU_13230 [Nitrospiraceae bacterium]